MRYRVYSFGAPTRHLLMIDADDAQSAALRFVYGFADPPPFDVVVVMAEGSSNAIRFSLKDLRRCARGSGQPMDASSRTTNPEPGRTIPSEEKRHGETLGLQGPVTPQDVKQRYRELVALYHPDKVVHLGPKLRAAAEHEMKAINEAFAYFRDRYGF